MPTVVLNKFFPTDILLENTFIDGHANNIEFKYLRSKYLNTMLYSLETQQEVKCLAYIRHKSKMHLLTPNRTEAILISIYISYIYRKYIYILYKYIFILYKGD